MIRLVTRGRFTQDYAKGLVGAPEDREPAVRKLIEGVGGKIVSFYFTTGDSDFMLISEANEAESIIAALLAASSSGAISNVTTARAWTGAEFKAVAEKASKAASLYRAPGKR
ncbi:MAG: GYD domain-containing protein [Hyphomicrobiales bacterium]|nr:GYD domain-containing protein [Hyphomicrobiales bacterium]MBV9114830.1 GYD domain-containing protein [Hyphomicrobiales bacterium]MBV9520300.1 GYD domain-containing protein [Hyphomicrobiales bacterium]